MRSRKIVAKRNDFESVLLRWIIKFNIREERLVELLSVAEKIWPAQLEAKISESRARVFFLTLEKNLRVFNHLAQVLVVCLAQKVSKLGWREFIEWKYVVWSLKEILLVDVSIIRVTSFRFAGAKGLIFFQARVEILPFFFFFQIVPSTNLQKSDAIFFSPLEKKCTFVYKWRRI